MPLSRQAVSRRASARAGHRVLALALVAGVLGLLGLPGSVDAAGTELFGASVSPGQGTTATTFVLSVNYASSPVRDALSVRAEIVDAELTLDLVRIDGDAAAGTWRASSSLPAGTWTVIFRADAVIGFDPTLMLADAVVVTQATPPPSATPATTPRPNPSPTARPTPRPTPPTARPTPRPTTVPTLPATPAPTTRSPTVAPTGTAPFTPPVTAAPAAGGSTASTASTGPSASAVSSTPSPVAAVVPGIVVPGTTPGAVTPAPEPAAPATAPSHAPDAAPTGFSMGRGAWLLLGGTLTLLGGAVLARQWLRRRPPRPGR